MKKIAVVLASTILIGAAYAQPAATPTSSSAQSAMMKADAKRDMGVEKHITELHAKLKITAAEETQWAAVAKAMRDSAGELDTAIDKRKSTMGSGTAVDDLNAYGDIAQAHADSVRKLSTAFAPLYAAMPDEQKMLADEVFTRRPHHAMKHSKQ
jgi:hypothetical protein